MKKNILYLFVSFGLLTLIACNNKSTSNENATLQIMGFKSEVVAETSDIQRLQFKYYLNKETNSLMIDRVDEAGSILEKNVSQFGLTSLGHASDDALITEAKISYKVTGACVDSTILYQEFGPTTTFNDANGKETIDLTRNVNLPALVNQLHNELVAKNGNCLSLSKLNETFTTQEATIVLHISFNVTTKDDKHPWRQIILTLVSKKDE